MSNLDYQSGLGAGYAQARTARRDADQLSDRLRTLQQRLEKADEQTFFKKAEFDANDLVLKLALEALQKLDPSSPLLDKGNRDIIRRRHIGSVLATKGYKFDVATGHVDSNRKSR